MTRPTGAGRPTRAGESGQNGGGRPDVSSEGFTSGPKKDERSKRVLIVHPFGMVRDLYQAFLAGHDSSLTVFGATSVDEVTEELVNEQQISLIVLPDLVEEHTTASEQLLSDLRKVRTAAPTTPIAVVANAEDWGSVASVFDAGGDGLIPMDTSAELLVHGLHTLIAGGTYLPPAVVRGRGMPPGTSAAQMSNVRVADFTPRQRQVLELLLEGLPNKLIAYQLNMKESTVKIHIRHIMKKVKARNRTQVVVALRDSLQRGRERPSP